MEKSLEFNELMVIFRKLIISHTEIIWFNIKDHTLQNDGYFNRCHNPN